MDFIIETPRLLLREMDRNDIPGLKEILQDEKTMYAYEHAFSDKEVINWLNKQLKNYSEHGMGLWAVILKENGRFIGQCGITYQNCDGETVPEIGYLFNRSFWHRGYASEAAAACKEFAFNKLGFNEVYSIIRDTNEASVRVAERNGMTRKGSFVKHYWNLDMPHYIYSIKKPADRTVS